MRFAIHLSWIVVDVTRRKYTRCRVPSVKPHREGETRLKGEKENKNFKKKRKNIIAIHRYPGIRGE